MTARRTTFRGTRSSRRWLDRLDPRIRSVSAQARVWCLRHAESENVTAGLAGAVPNAQLTEHGHQQSVRAARTLADETIRGVYASTAVRAGETARWPSSATSAASPSH
ncbi:histidine phosphatase family protein [Promicromonospora sp. NPDC090134]|uniref:histidine phosphatase family protein n=1 Tax=Promicromonospora sp. NPDC090134 TaxID=3364408 RepID=UPI00380E349B